MVVCDVTYSCHITIIIEVEALGGTMSTAIAHWILLNFIKSRWYLIRYSLYKCWKFSLFFDFFIIFGIFGIFLDYSKSFDSSLYFYDIFGISRS